MTLLMELILKNVTKGKTVSTIENRGGYSYNTILSCFSFSLKILLFFYKQHW